MTSKRRRLLSLLFVITCIFSQSNMIKDNRFIRECLWHVLGHVIVGSTTS